MTEQIHRAKINKSNDRTNTQNEDKQVVIWLVYLRSVYLFCHSTCLSSFCVFILSLDLFIFALCICSVIPEDKQVEWQNKYTERRQTSRMTEQIHRAKINKWNDRTNTQSEDKQVKFLCICSVIWLVYLRSVYLFCHLTCLSSLCVFVLHRAKINKSNDRTNTQTKINKSNDRTNTQNEDKQVKWQNKYTERR
jgi:hypothetical protein